MTMELALIRMLVRFQKLLTRFASSQFYNRFREESIDFAEKAPFSERLGIKATLQKMHDSAKSFFSPPSMLFEQLGWRYFGTIDGHNLQELLDIIKQVKNLDGPIVIHIITQKKVKDTLLLKRMHINTME